MSEIQNVDKKLKEVVKKAVKVVVPEKVITTTKPPEKYEVTSTLKK